MTHMKDFIWFVNLWTIFFGIPFVVVRYNAQDWIRAFMTSSLPFDNRLIFDQLFNIPNCCYDLAKRLSYYLYFFSFLFLFFYLGLTTQKEVRESIMSQVSHSHITWQKVTASHHMMSHDKSHDRHGKEVHRPCSSCISSVENLTGTLSSSLCQSLNKEQLALFRLGV